MPITVDNQRYNFVKQFQCFQKIVKNQVSLSTGGRNRGFISQLIVCSFSINRGPYL